MRRWLQRFRLRSQCFHHDRRSGESWIREQLIDTGMRKMLWCDNCQRTWIP